MQELKKYKLIFEHFKKLDGWDWNHCVTSPPVILKTLTGQEFLEVEKMEITGCEVRAIEWMIKHLPAELLKPCVAEHYCAARQHRHYASHAACSEWPVTLSIHHLTSGQEVDEENALPVPEHCAYHFPCDKVCLNSVLQGNPL